MVNALKYSLVDNWSFAERKESYEDRVNQVTKGFGFYVDYNDQVVYIRIDSPADRAGLKRGDIIEKINSQPAEYTDYINAENNLNVEAIFGVNRAGNYLDIAITPLQYNYKTVKYQLITNLEGIKVGHLIFNEFTSESVDEIDEAFTYFKSNEVNELIIDLRYNGGGNLAIASILMDKIAGYSNENAIQMKLHFNANYSHQNTTFSFEKDVNSLNINRVFFLTGYNSASASETVINGLKPYMDVKLIGSRTHGKPVGMIGRFFNDYIYWLISFSVYNVNNQGDFYDGIDVDCYANDNINFSRMDLNGDMLKEALYYIANDSCS